MLDFCSLLFRILPRNNCSFQAYETLVLNISFLLDTSLNLNWANLSMEKLFPTGNQMIDPRIRYANEP